MFGCYLSSSETEWPNVQESGVVLKVDSQWLGYSKYHFWCMVPRVHCRRHFQVTHGCNLPKLSGQYSMDVG